MADLLPGIQYYQGTNVPGAGGTDPNATTAGYGASTNPDATISSSSLAPTNSFNYTQPQQVPIYPVAGLNSTAPLGATPQEQKASDLGTQIQDLNTQLIGESAYKTDQLNANGYSDLLKTQNDLTARSTALKNEALAIPLQLQQNSEGRGITAGGLQPIQTAALRNNAIQSLSVNSLLEASRGNITLAQDLADRAVAQKFDPIKEEIAAKTKNLQLILNDPQTSLQDKNRAQAQLDIQNRKNAEATQAAENQKLVMGWQVEALKNHPEASEIIQSVANMSPQQALATLGQYLKVPPTGDLQYIPGTAHQASGYFNKTTGKFTPTGGGGAGGDGTQTPYKSELATTGIESVDGLLSIARGNPGIFGRTAALPIPGFLRSDDFRNYSAQLDYLKGNIIPAALTAMREASKTGGALGQVSDREGAWLSSSLGALDMSQSPEEVVNQLNLIKGHLQAWQNAVQRNTTPAPVQEQTLTAPDGTEVILTD